MSETLVLASWMESSLDPSWPWQYKPKPEPSAAKEALIYPTKPSYLPKFSMSDISAIPVRELTNSLLSQFGKLRQKAKSDQQEVPSVDTVVLMDKGTTFFDNTRTLVVQATKYLVEANKKNQLPHQIASEEFHATAIDIVNFLEQLANQAGRQAKKASLEILAFSEQAQANTNHNQPHSSIPEGKIPHIFQLTQGALRFMDPHSFFKDSQLYMQSVAKLSEMVAKGVANETSLVTAKKKGLSF